MLAKDDIRQLSIFLVYTLYNMILYTIDILQQLQE